MENSWKMEEFTATQIHKNQDEGKMVVPSYQRGFVWKKEQENELIDSIKKGLPFGSMLLYKDENKGNYRIIDGLQRSKPFINSLKTHPNTLMQTIYKMK